MSRCLAILIAPGSSAERDDCVLLGGLPLVAHAVRAARAASSVTRLVVATQDEAVIAASRRLGAEVVATPATEGGAVVMAVLEALDGAAPDLVLLLDAAFPLVTGADLDQLVARLDDASLSSALLAAPIPQAVWAGEPPVRHTGGLRECGAVVARRSAWSAGELPLPTATVVVDASRALTAKDELDAAQIEAVMLREQRRVMASRLPNPLEAVVFDFDGVFTDNRVLVTDDGHEAVHCHRGDGLGLEHLRDGGLHLLILSKERNPVVARRAEKLKLPCQQSTDDKVTYLTGWLAERGISPEATIYVGNDVNDVGPLQMVGLGVAVADAHPAALAAAQMVLTKAGGMGAIRELCDLIESQLS
ncbi:MAG: 2-C-methyl-D-erythritol 4-phosphate cytidylyltransferase [Myxococcales bacterium]|nr:2-C-methyl-D-erythritol 4-phosphate cytidylyltransferase [Myxococcales bacterium]